MDSVLDRDTMTKAPLGYINGRPKTRYEYLLERELESRKTKQSFIRLLTAVVIAQSLVIAWLIIPA